MTAPQPLPDAGTTDAPLDNFSQCHAGIIGHLDQLNDLPMLLEQAARARRVARSSIEFFHQVVLEHHAQEERELFPAVRASARRGAERDQVDDLIDRLTAEHREIEALWIRLEPTLKAMARGQQADLDAVSLRLLIETYTLHARFEEESFLPLSQTILGRNANHMAALGISLHMRQALPDVLRTYGHRI